jgi:hypothetical protein
MLKLKSKDSVENDIERYLHTLPKGKTGQVENVIESYLHDSIGKALVSSFKSYSIYLKP